MTAFERVLDALEARGLRRGRAFRCPAHDDRGPSLSVRDGDDTVLIYCHAGCSLREILAKLDLGLDDLYEEGVWHSWTAVPAGSEAYVPPPPPPGYIVWEGERYPTDWRAVTYEPEEPTLQFTPQVGMVDKLYPQLRWLTQHPLEVRAWLCAMPHLEALRRNFPEVPEWIWTTLRLN